MNVWNTITEGLGSDERVVFPWMYEAYPDLYDDIRTRGYLIRERREGAEVSWCASHTLERVLSSKVWEVLDEVYIVRLRLPWRQTQFEWTMSLDELNEFREDYHVIDTYIRVMDKETGKIRLVLDDRADFEENRDRYDILEIRFLVRWKSSVEAAGTYLSV